MQKSVGVAGIEVGSRLLRTSNWHRFDLLLS